MRRPKILLLCAAAAFFALIAVQPVFPFLPRGGKLKGVTRTPEPVAWSWEAYRSGALFRNLEAWFELNVGLRNLWVALDNQVNYSVFHETPPPPLEIPPKPSDRTRIIVGSGDWLYERHYLEYALGGTIALITPAERSAHAALVRRLQDKLHRRGLSFVIAVAPSKAEILGEHIPQSLYAGRRMEEHLSPFEKMRPEFDAAGVEYFDGPTRFAAWKAAGQPNLFARSGTHWSYLAAAHVLMEMRDKLNPHLRRPLPEIRIARAPVGPPRFADRDLLDLTNLLFTDAPAHPIPFPEFEKPEAPPETLPRLLWINDSFGEVLIDLAHRAGVVRPGVSLHYVKGPLDLPSGEPFDVIPRGDLKPGDYVRGAYKDRMDWEAYLAGFDAVVVVWTEIAADFRTWGFLEAMDKGLK